MPCQLPVDCLNGIFEYLQEDKAALRSCLLVNRLWCEVSVQILWTNIQNYNTLIACLPHESKEFLHKNEIIILAPTSKPPLFNYVAFIKSLSIKETNIKIENLLKNHQPEMATTSTITLPISSNSSYIDKITLVKQEIFKMFMNQISLKSLKFNDLICLSNISFSNIPFITYPGAIGCLRNLSELTCDTDIDSEFFCQMSQICHNLQSLKIIIRDIVSDGLTNLISFQQNLRYLYLSNFSESGNWARIISSITKLADNLIKLYIDGGEHFISLSFIASFTNLQKLSLSSNHHEDFKTLQYVAFPQLQILKFKYQCPNHEYFNKFLEINGNNLKTIQLCNNLLNYYLLNNNLLNLAVAKFCPNLKSLFTLFYNDEIDTLKLILISCQQLERIKVWYSDDNLNEDELLEVVAKYSPKTFRELEIVASPFSRPRSFLEGIETFFTSWSNHIPQKSLSLIIKDPQNRFKVKKEIMEVIEEFQKLGIIKKFEMIHKFSLKF